MLKTFKSLGATLTPEFATQFTSRISNALIKRFATLSENDVKKCDMDQIEMLLTQVNILLNIALDKQDRCKIIETTEIMISLRFLKSSNFERRIRGLQNIRNMIDRVVKTEKLKNNKTRMNQQLTMDNYVGDVQI